MAFVTLVGASLAADPILLVSPTNIVIGKEYSILIQDPACLKDPTKAVFKIKEEFPSFGLAPGLVFSALTEGKDRCEFTYTLKVGNDAQISTLSIPLFRSLEDSGKKILKSEILQMVLFTVNSVLKGPIPPGVSPKGEVDVSYDVLPYRVTADNFGRRVAETYFAVQATIGNSTGYSLLLRSLILRPKVFKNNSMLALTPNTQYGMVRSTLEREQQVGRRSISVNIARGIIPMISTAGALFTGPAAADFAIAAGMYGLTEKIFELVYPDKTVRQLVALDSRSFRDGMLLKNNDQQVIQFFIHREIVMCAVKDPACKKSEISGSDIHLNDRLKYAKEFNPPLVKSKLGSLTIIGEQIAFSNRLVVTSIDESKVGVAPPATIYQINLDLEVEQGKVGVLKMTGVNLDTLTVPESADLAKLGITLGTPVVTSDKAVATIKVVIADDAKPGPQTISIGAAGLSRPFYLTIKPATPVLYAPTAPSEITIANKAPEVITVTGKFLDGAKIQGTFTLAPATAATAELSFSKDLCEKGSCKITVTAALPPGGPFPGVFKVKLVVKKDNVADVAVATITVNVTK